MGDQSLRVVVLVFERRKHDFNVVQVQCAVLLGAMLVSRLSLPRLPQTSSPVPRNANWTECLGNGTRDA